MQACQQLLIFERFYGMEDEALLCLRAGYEPGIFTNCSTIRQPLSPLWQIFALGSIKFEISRTDFQNENE